MRLQPYIKAIGAPDWIIEIISPGSRQMDYYTKLFKYQTAGIREYWIVDQEKNRILIYNFETEQTGDYTFSDSVKAGIYDDLYIDFSDISEFLKQ
jgi:Uma2 family endonuclease